MIAIYQKEGKIMSLVTKENIKVGMKVYSCWDDTPIDGFGCVEAIIKAIYDDHFIYKEPLLDNIWGEYDDGKSSVAVFTDKEDAEKWFFDRGLPFQWDDGGYSL